MYIMCLSDEKFMKTSDKKSGNAIKEIIGISIHSPSTSLVTPECLPGMIACFACKHDKLNWSG